MTASVATAVPPAEAAFAVESPGRRALRRLLQRRAAMAALVLIVVIVLLAVLAPSIAPYDPAKQSWSAVRKAPSMPSDQRGTWPSRPTHSSVSSTSRMA